MSANVVVEPPSSGDRVAHGADEVAADVVRRALARAPLPAPSDIEALIEAIGPFAVVDLETTGLDPTRARVIEIGAVVLRPRAEPQVLHAFVDPREPLPLLTRRLTGLSDADLVGAPSWNEASRRVAEKISGLAIVAHNAAFERAFLGGLLPQSTSFLDSLELACVLRPELASHSLQALSLGFFDRRERHRAVDDALDTLAVLLRFHDALRAGAHRRLVAALGAKNAWEWAPFARRASAARWSLGQAPSDRAPDRSEAHERDTSRSAADAAPGSPIAVASRIATTGELDAELVREILADEARWRVHFPGYRVREGQIDLACAILDAFQSERSVAAEAGTGIGKTLTYALVSVLYVQRHGARVVVSSANRTLQERLVREELPRIARVLGIPPVPALVLKGRANYACPRRMRTIATEGEALGFPMSPSARLYATSFLERCADGDLQGFGGWLAAQQPVLWSVRDRVACSSDCDEMRCRADSDGPCPYLRRVDELRGAAIVSVNHSLLLAWPPRYGPIDRLIVDEAHELAGEADRSFAEEVRARDLRNRLRQLGDDGGSAGLIGALGRGSAEAEEGAHRTAEAARRAGAIAEQVGRLLTAVSPAGEVVVPAGDRIELDSPWEHALHAVRDLGGACTDLAEEIADLVRRAPNVDGARDASASEASLLAGWLAATARGLLADVLAQTRADTVYAARGIRRVEHHDWWLRATPLETGHLVHARLLEPARTTIAVSATLGVGGDPGPSLRKIGWQRIEKERRLPTLVVPSPFDFRNRTRLAFVRRGNYRDRGFVDRCARSIADVASLLGGRTLALFTSRQRMSDVVARLAPRLAEEGIAVLAHERSGGAARLVEQFAADPRAVLVGTRSLWQGVDIPGDALSCVVIDKLPFPRPDDPLTRGRAQRILDAGDDPFPELSLEPAVIAFKQMFGRLVRAESDRGFVIVLGADAEKPYVEEFVRSLPGPPPLLVAEWEGILQAMREFFAEGDAARSAPS